jgi:osmotically-inducible protein OsmY
MPIVMKDADADLRRRVVQYLAARHMPGLKNLDIEAQGGTVRITGTVRSFYEKQLCQNICRRVAGVINLIDEVDVAAPEALALAN